VSSTHSSKNPFFHGGCAWVPQDDQLFITSNLLQPVDPAQTSLILISKVKLHRKVSGDVESVTWAKLRPPPSMPMPAGVLPWWTTDAEGQTHWGVFYCSQGNLASPGGIFSMQAGLPPYPHLTNFFGTEFGCLRSMAVHNPPDLAHRAEWFVDAGSRGFRDGFRGPPELPAAVWRYNAVREDLRMMTDDVTCPWGIAVSPDEETVYITDSNPVTNESGVVQKDM
jgi:gluconolactonase